MALPPISDPHLGIPTAMAAKLGLMQEIPVTSITVEITMGTSIFDSPYDFSEFNNFGWLIGRSSGTSPRVHARKSNPYKVEVIGIYRNERRFVVDS